SISGRACRRSYSGRRYGVGISETTRTRGGVEFTCGIFERIDARGLNLAFGAVAGLTVATTTVCVVLGSSSVSSVKSFGGHARWLALAALWSVGAWRAFSRRRTLAGLSPPALAALLLAAVLLALGLLSAAWSGDPRLTVHRVLSFGLVLTTAAALAA